VTNVVIASVKLQWRRSSSEHHSHRLLQFVVYTCQQCCCSWAPWRLPSVRVIVVIVVISCSRRVCYSSQTATASQPLCRYMYCRLRRIVAYYYSCVNDTHTTDGLYEKSILEHLAPASRSLDSFYTQCSLEGQTHNT